MQPLQVLPTEQSQAGDFARLLAIAVGPAYNAGPGTKTGADFLALGDALAGAYNTNLASLAECFADTAVQMLPEWEAMLGLQVRPDLTTAQRQTRLVAKIRAAFSGSPQDILTALRTVAPEVTITEILAADAISSGNPCNVFKFIVFISTLHINDANISKQVIDILEQMKPAHTSYSIVSSRPFFLDISPMDLTAL
jgi:hypothetical protein